jgi:hypothetical protein
VKIYMDWEFIEDGKTIEPISVGLVHEEGPEYYAIFDEPNTLRRAAQHPWIRDNVLPSLPLRLNAPNPWWGWWDTFHPDYEHVKPRDQIVAEVRDLIQATPGPELWGWYSAYDHVCLAQLFGPMIDLPDGIPMWTNDLKQEAVRLGNPRLPEQESGEHNALADARHIKVMAEYLAKVEAARG